MRVIQTADCLDKNTPLTTLSGKKYRGAAIYLLKTSFRSFFVSVSNSHPLPLRSPLFRKTTQALLNQKTVLNVKMFQLELYVLSYKLFSHTSLNCPFRAHLICSTGNTVVTCCHCVGLHVYLYMLTQVVCLDSVWWPMLTQPGRTPNSWSFGYVFNSKTGLLRAWSCLSPLSKHFSTVSLRQALKATGNYFTFALNKHCHLLMHSTAPVCALHSVMQCFYFFLLSGL